MTFSCLICALNLCSKVAQKGKICSRVLEPQRVAQKLPSTIGRGLVALDNSRLGLENKLLGNKSGRIFCFRQVYFTKSCQQIWGCVNQPFILFIHHIWGETVQFIIQTSYKMQYFINFQDKLHSVNIHSGRSIVCF